MSEQRVRNAISASAITLALSVASLIFLIHLSNQSVQPIAMIVLVSLTLCVSMVMHFIFVGLTAQRLGRNVALWVALSLVCFPIASIVGLILIEWFNEEKNEPPAAAS